MAKWGTFNWGDGTHWGSTATPADTVTWIVQIDWDGDGSLDGANEAVRLIGFSLRAGREDYLSGNGDGFEHMRIGQATLVFDDADGRYDARNVNSPLYPYVQPGRKVQIRVRNNVDESTYTLFTGIIDRIAPKGYRDEVTMICVDYGQWLSDQELTFDAELFNTTITGALNHLLTQAAYPGGRLLDVDNQPVWVFAVNKERAIDVAHQLADAGLGIFWIDQYGRARYQKRDHSESGTSLDQSVFLNEPMISQPWDGVYNHIITVSRRFIKQQPAPIFTLPDAVYIANSNDETIAVNYPPATEVQVASVAGNTQPDGNGTAKTMTVTAVSLGLTGGTVTVANNSGTNAYLIELNIRGRKYTDTEQQYTAVDATSQARYGIRRFRLRSPFLQDANYAAAFATILKNFAKDDRESLKLKIRGRPALQYSIALMDFIEFTSETLGIDAVTYQVLGLDHDWLNDNGQDVLTTLYLHKTLASSASITPASLEVAPRVPDAPGGYGGSGTDISAGGFTIDIYHNGVFVGTASEIDFQDSDYAP